MIRMRSLGTIDLTDGQGMSIDAVLRQPKRFALLAFVATRRPAPRASRERLLGMFWPELDLEHARNALNKTLHFLRRELPADVVVSLGRTRIGIATERLVCDAVDFRAALQEGSGGKALLLYAGPFLPSLHVSDAPALAEWLESERDWYRTRARGAGLALLDADLARGRVQAALEWASVLDRISPNDEEVVGASVRAHLRAGDRAAALDRMERYEKWLREEMGLGVPAELVRLLGDEPRPNRTQAQPERSTDEPPPELLAASRAAVRVQTLEEYREFVELLPDMAYRCDIRGSFPFVNQATVRAMGLSREEFRNTSYDQLVREDFRDRIIEFYVRQVDERIPLTYLEFPAVTKDGRELWVGQRVRLLERDGTPVGIEAVTRDITTRVRREKANRRTALEDRETRLLNRDGFSVVVQQRIRENRRSGEPFFVIHVRLQSTVGGDNDDDLDRVTEAVRIVAGALRDTVREPDALGRMGEAEIAVLSPSGDETAADALCGRVEAALHEVSQLHELSGVAVDCHTVVHDPLKLYSADAVMTFAWVVEE